MIHLLVHDIDVKDAKYGREEAAGIGQLVAGIAAAHPDDEARLARGAALFDDLYALAARRSTDGARSRSAAHATHAPWGRRGGARRLGGRPLTLELPYVIVAGQRGFGDLVLGTEVMPLRESADLPGVALSFEWKLANGSLSKGLGSGSMEFGLLLRSQKTWGWFTLIANLGYAFVTEPVVGGVPLERQGVWFVGLAPELALSGRVSLLSDFYWRTADVPGEAARLAADIGFQYEVVRHLEVQAAMGTSLRPGAVGGPRLRSYLGLHWVLPVF